MIFRQLFEPQSCTYTYLIGCKDTGKVVLIDPVIETVNRDLSILQAMGLSLDYSLETHVHADHLTGALKLKHLVNSQIAGPAIDNLACTDIGIAEGTPFKVGNIDIHPLFTPGHTNGHHAYLIDNGSHQLLFSGDALLIEACGRTDFQEGDASTLYHSIHDKIFSQADETLIYPGHDYEGRQLTTVAQEKQRNPRLKNNTSLADFINIMDNLNLPYPKKIDFAVPGNQLCGSCPDNVPAEFRSPCALHEQG